MKKIIISGANEGIGYFIAEQLLKDGNVVYVLDIHTDNIDKLKEIYPQKLLAFKCDVSDYERVKKCLKDIDGNIDIVIHNACKCTFDSFKHTDIDTFEEVFKVNYYGAIHMTKASLEKMKSGEIIYVSSGVAIMGFQNISPYAGSKNAIESLAKCLNIEYKNTPISFHIIHPPLTNTRSSSPLPIPSEFMKSPEIVGKGIAKRINKRSFIICNSFLQLLQTRLLYLFPIQFGRLFSKLTYDSDKYTL